MVFKINPDKIQRYLLSSHTVDAEGKRKFFEDVAGYSLKNWQLLHDHLLEHPKISKLDDTDEDKWGSKVIYKCFLPESPCGRKFCILSIWQERSDGAWHLVTAYPTNN